MTSGLVYIANGELTPEQREQISLAAGAQVIFADEITALDSIVDKIEAVAGFVSPELLASAPRLRWVQSWAAGPDSQLYPEMVASPVVLTCCKGNGAVPLAEHAMMLMLLLNRDAQRWFRAQAEHRWDHFSHGELIGGVCGIIGLGHSGVALAQRAKAFDMTVLGVRRHTDQPVPHVDRLYRPDELQEFLPQLDFLVVTAPLTPETRGMIGAAELKAMKPTSHIICFSRGGIVDDTALLTALTDGWIAGAGLDVHGVEPLPPESPFWTAPNTIVTPHNGASTPGTRQRGVDIFIDNLRRFAAGEPLRNVVDKVAGY